MSLRAILRLFAPLKTVFRAQITRVAVKLLSDVLKFTTGAKNALRVAPDCVWWYILCKWNHFLNTLENTKKCHKRTENA